MKIDSIKDGIVLDHIKAGRAMEIYKYLKLNEYDNSVAIIQNAKSGKMGKKDIVKIDSICDINFDILGYIDPDITVNIIKDGVLVEKKTLKLPETLVNVLKCKNPRCITTDEQELDQVFKLADAEKRVYRCMYCDTKSTNK